MAAHIARQCKAHCYDWLATMLANVQKNNLWQKMLKNTICTTVAVIIGIHPATVAVYGRLTYLAPMTTVFGHPGRRFGQMAEALILIILGCVLGLTWSLLGLYLSSLVIDTHMSGAFAIRAVFFALGVIFHGVLRSSTPRLFLMVFFFLLISLGVLTSSQTVVTITLVSRVAYPVLTAAALILLVNVSLFPETSSGFLGNSTIESLGETVKCLEDAVKWFTSDSLDRENAATNSKQGPDLDLRMKLVSLSDRKPKLRAKLAASKSAQAECNFELVYACLPPRSLKPVSTNSMSRLVQNTISIVNACESKYALVGEDDDNATNKENTISDDSSDSGDSSDSSTDSSSDDSSSEDDSASRKKPEAARKKSKHLRNLELVKPLREIESGDIGLLEHILSQVRAPSRALQQQIHEAHQVITCTLAYCYDVPKIPGGSRAPDGIKLEEIDIRVDAFVEALSQFDRDSVEALEHAAAMAYGDNYQADIMPRMETFLVSSFLITLRQAACQILDMIKHCRVLVEKRETRFGRKRLYMPAISWKKWLKTGGELDVNTLPEHARKEARAGHGTREDKRGDNDELGSGTHEELARQPNDEESGGGQEKQEILPEKGKIPRRKGPHWSASSTSLWLRGLVADAVEFFADSDDLAFALKMTFAAFLITFPAFVPSFNPWYNSVRGTWASLQLIIVFEVAVGTSFQGFFYRAYGVIYGCVAGYLANIIGGGDRAVIVVVLCICIFPATYVHLGTPYVKTGLISIVSMSVVGLATVTQPNTSTWEVFVKRLCCFLIGGTVALLVEMTLFPVRARDRLGESLASSIQQIMKMEASVAVGIDSPGKIDFKSHALSADFVSAKDKADAALVAARTFLPVCLTEPRLKGSFEGQAMIYNEVIYVLFQIIDRMDNMLHLRKAYGSGVLEEIHDKVLPYRRNVAASIALTLFAVHEALTTRLPLPQFLPSSRVAQFRYISRVREAMLERAESGPISRAASAIWNKDARRPAKDARRPTVPLQGEVLKSVTKHNFLSWNARAAGMIEIIEYLEELVDLTKLLVGVNAFRSGMLERPKFHEYIAKIKSRQLESVRTAETEHTVEKIRSAASDKIRGRKRGFSLRQMDSQLSGGLRRRPTCGSSVAGDGTAESFTNENAVEDLPMSLQRIQTKRMEDREFERLKRSSTIASQGKGKGVSKGKVWGI